MAPRVDVCSEPFADCWELRPTVHEDERGRFVKPFASSAMDALGGRFQVEELYYSTSCAGTIRGLHLQVAPHSMRKLVFVTAGEVVDVLLDLRPDSPTLGEFRLVGLSAELGNAVLIADGVAHGFCVPTGSATVVYAVTAAYVPDADTGVRWDSAGIPWPTNRPIVSPRDSALPTLQEFLANHGSLRGR